MSIQNWQVFQARELGFLAGNTPKANIVGALVVRWLIAKNPGLDVLMLPVPQATQDEFLIEADLPAPYVAALQKLYTTVGRTSSGEYNPNRRTPTRGALWMLARVAYLHLPPQEIEAAYEIAQRAQPLKSIAEIYGFARAEEAQVLNPGAATDDGWGDDSWTGTWEGFHGLRGAKGLKGLGSLRDELTTNPGLTPAQQEDVADVYDTLASSTSTRRSYVREWQTWAQELGRYTGRIDGWWGSLSETAWVFLVPTSYGRATTKKDLDQLSDDYGLSDIVLVAAAISRDIWLAANPSNPVEPPVPRPDEPTEDEWAAGWGDETPSEPSPSGTPPLGPEDTVTVTPVETPEMPHFQAKLPQYVVTTPLPDDTVVITPIEEEVEGSGVTKKTNTTAWVLGLSALGLIGAGVVYAGRKAS